MFLFLCLLDLCYCPSTMPAVMLLIRMIIGLPSEILSLINNFFLLYVALIMLYIHSHRKGTEALENTVFTHKRQWKNSRIDWRTAEYSTNWNWVLSKERGKELLYSFATNKFIIKAINKYIKMENIRRNCKLFLNWKMFNFVKWERKYFLPAIEYKHQQ